MEHVVTIVTTPATCRMTEIYWLLSATRSSTS
jgi:hypothetical protein